MLSKLIEIAIKSALQNQEIKSRLGVKKGNKTIDLDKNSYKVME